MFVKFKTKKSMTKKNLSRNIHTKETQNVCIFVEAMDIKSNNLTNKFN